MESDKVTPFGEYGVHINDSRQNSICKPDMNRLSECEYLMQRGCSFDIYKWSGTDYEKELCFNGNNFDKTGLKPIFNGMPSMHIWFETIEDLQKWLGKYYDSAITAMLANKNNDILNTQYDQNMSSSWVSGMITPNSVNSWSYLTNPQQILSIGQGVTGQTMNTSSADKIAELLNGLDDA